MRDRCEQRLCDVPADPAVSRKRRQIVRKCAVWRRAQKKAPPALTAGLPARLSRLRLFDSPPCPSLIAGTNTAQERARPCSPPSSASILSSVPAPSCLERRGNPLSPAGSVPSIQGDAGLRSTLALSAAGLQANGRCQSGSFRRSPGSPNPGRRRSIRWRLGWNALAQRDANPGGEIRG
jgi:hypothetical protein